MISFGSLTVWVFERLLWLTQTFAKDSEIRTTISYVSQCREALEKDGVRVLIRLSLKILGSLIVRTREVIYFSFVSVLSGAVVLQILIYFGIWYAGTFNAFPGLQDHLPWKIYHQAIVTANTILEKQSPVAPLGPDIERHLHALINNAGIPTKAVFSAIYILVTATLLAIVFRTALRCAGGIIADFGDAIRLSQLLFFTIGTWILLIVLESGAFAAIAVMQYPPIWITLYPLIGLVSQSLVATEVFVVLSSLVFSFVGRMTVSSGVILGVRLAATPLRLTAWMFLVCLGILIMGPILKFVMIRFAMSAERALDRQSKDLKRD